jgi:glucosamine-6-phosphate deaminase
MKWEMVEDYPELSARAAERMLLAIEQDPHLVLGLPTGRTPEGMYARVVEGCSRRYRCFQDVVTFNLDEYVGIEAAHRGSYSAYMRRHLFEHVDMRPGNIHIPDGMAARVRGRRPELELDEALVLECQAYEEQLAEAGGLGLCFLGLGVNGHIGFNEPGAPFGSRTRLVELAHSTREANAGLFPDGRVPDRAITMGIGTILESGAIVLLASGEAKAEAVGRLAHGPVSEAMPATALRAHTDVTVIVDRAAAHGLT